MPIDDQPLEYKLTLYFDMSCDGYVENFNKMMIDKSHAFNHLEQMTPQSSKNSYSFKRGSAKVLSNPKEMSTTHG